MEKENSLRRNEPGLTSMLLMSVVPSARLTEQEKQEIVRLCTRAFNKDFSTLSHFEEAATHVLASINGRIVGHAVWTTREFQVEESKPLSTAYVDAVATDPDLHMRGIGRAVMQRLAGETQEYELRALATGTVSFYARLEWELWLGPKAVRKSGKIIPVQNEGIMVMSTLHTPRCTLHGLLVADWREGLLF